MTKFLTSKTIEALIDEVAENPSRAGDVKAKLREYEAIVSPPRRRNTYSRVLGRDRQPVHDGDSFFDNLPI